MTGGAKRFAFAATRGTQTEETRRRSTPACGRAFIRARQTKALVAFFLPRLNRTLP